MSSGLERGGHALTVLHPRGAWRGLTSVPQTVRGTDVSPAGRGGVGRRAISVEKASQACLEGPGLPRKGRQSPGEAALARGAVNCAKVTPRVEVGEP